MGVDASAGALALCASVGGRSADALDGLATSLRDRLAVGAEARALSSQARMSAMVVGRCSGGVHRVVGRRRSARAPCAHRHPVRAHLACCSGSGWKRSAAGGCAPSSAVGAGRDHTPRVRVGLRGGVPVRRARTPALRLDAVARAGAAPTRRGVADDWRLGGADGGGVRTRPLGVPCAAGSHPNAPAPAARRRDGASGRGRGRPDRRRRRRRAHPVSRGPSSARVGRRRWLRASSKRPCARARWDSRSTMPYETWDAARRVPAASSTRCERVRASDHRPGPRSPGSRSSCVPICAAGPRREPGPCPCASASRSWAASCPPLRCSPWSRPLSPASRADRPALPRIHLRTPRVRSSTWEVERAAIVVQRVAVVAATR